METLVEQVERLKRERDAVILAHYYVSDEVQAVADYVGDSYYLSKVATTVNQKTICLCGVQFMGESAKLLNPEKRVIIPDANADCPMAHMVDLDRINKVRAEYEDVAVVCYINSTATLKQYADVCVTSANAKKVVESLPNKTIYFIPDEHLGRYIASQLPEKQFIFNDGFCHVHTSITADAVKKAKEARPKAKVLVHPECKQEVLELADYIGSTSGIIAYATKSQEQEFLICTEMGVFYELNKKNPDKKFYSVGHRQFCPNMKLITLEKVIRCLQEESPLIEIDEEKAKQARIPLERMLKLS
ncbi:quinolinate synthase NadA [Anaerosporobacter faecicola]|uniref:quinolinate synthase NadA n=1 Tax=Anaerosporobacter faecicola TaxID=2718714 RepID=UPI0014394E65|nr:quinolinate synthase NadA [Anaerosporobacter faecicola]